MYKRQEHNVSVHRGKIVGVVIDNQSCAINIFGKERNSVYKRLRRECVLRVGRVLGCTATATYRNIFRLNDIQKFYSGSSIATVMSALEQLYLGKVITVDKATFPFFLQIASEQIVVYIVVRILS